MSAPLARSGSARRVAGRPWPRATHRQGLRMSLRVRLGIEAARAAESVPAAEPPALAVRRPARRRRHRQPALGEERDGGERLRLVGAPLVAGLLLLGAGLVAAATAATRLRFFFGRGRPASLAPEIRSGANGGSPAADRGQGNPAPGRPHLSRSRRAPIEGLLYHWAPTLITAPREVQLLARRYMFNLAAIAATLRELRVLVVRVRQRDDAAVDRDPLLRVRPRLPAPAGARAAQGARDDGLARRPRRRCDPRPGGDRPRRGQAAAARRVLARHADLRHARHGARRVRPRDGGDPGRRSTPRRRRARASSRSGFR